MNMYLGLAWPIGAVPSPSGCCTSTEDGSRDTGTAVCGIYTARVMLALTEAQTYWGVRVTGRAHANSTAALWWYA